MLLNILATFFFYILLAINILLATIFVAREPLATFIEKQIVKNNEEISEFLLQRTSLEWVADDLSIDWKGLNPTVSVKRLSGCLPQNVVSEKFRSESSSSQNKKNAIDDASSRYCSLQIDDVYIYFDVLGSVLDLKPRLHVASADNLYIVLQQSGFNITLAGMSSSNSIPSLTNIQEFVLGFKSVSLNTATVALVDKTFDWARRSVWPSHSLRYYKSKGKGLLRFHPLDEQLDYISSRLVFMGSDPASSQNAKDSCPSWCGYLDTHFSRTVSAIEESGNIDAPYESMRMELSIDENESVFSGIIGVLGSAALESTGVESKRNPSEGVATTSKSVIGSAFAPLILSGHVHFQSLFSDSKLLELPSRDRGSVMEISWSPVLTESFSTAEFIGGGSIKILDDDNDFLLKVEQGRFSVEKTIDQFKLVFRPVGRIKTLLEQLNPRGEMRYLTMDVPLNDLDGFVAYAKIDGVSVESFKGRSPVVGNAHGWASLNRHGGFLQLDHDDKPTMITFPRVYNDPISFFPKVASINWFVGPERYYISGDELSIDYLSKEASYQSRDSGHEVSVRGRFYVDGRRNKLQSSSRLALEVAAMDGRAENILGLVPDSVSPQLRDWINASAFVGDFSNAAFIYNGSINRREPELRMFALGASVKSAELNYVDGWPKAKNLDASIHLNSNEFQAPIYTADISDLRGLQGKVNLVSYPWASELTTSLSFDHNAAALYKFLLTSPVQENVPNQISKWKVSGRLQGNVDTTLLFPKSSGLKSSPVNRGLNGAEGNSNQNIIVQTNATAKNAGLFIPELNLDLKKINGDIAFSTKTGFMAKKLRAALWGEPIEIQLGGKDAITNPDKGDNSSWQGDIAVNALGRVNTQEVIKWIFDDQQAPQRFSWISGVTNANFNFIANRENSYSKITSDLVGVSIDLPSPLGKSASVRRGLTVSRNKEEEDDNDVPLLVGLGEQMEAKVWQTDGSLEKMVVNLYPGEGKLKRSFENRLDERGDSTIRFGGHLPVLEVDEWLDFIEGNQQKAGLNLDGEIFEFFIDSLDIDTFKFGGRDLGATQLSVLQTEGFTKLDINNDTLVGLFSIPASVREQWGCSSVGAAVSKVPGDDLLMALPALPENLLRENRLIADIEFVQLNGLIDNASDLDSQAGDSKTWINPSCLFPMTARISSLNFGDKQFGNWRFDLSPGNDVALIHNVKGNVNGLNVTTAYDDGLRWAMGPDGAITSELTGGLISKEIKKVLESYLQLDDSPIVAEESQVNMAISWIGDPLEFSLEKMLGTIDFDLRDGRFIEISGAAGGFLKLVSLVNVQRYISRLSLDVSNIYRDGVSFDELSGTLNFEEGKASFYESPISMKASSSDFVFSGRADFINSSIDGELVATLPVSKNLPWLVAIAGGLPVAAGTFIATQALDAQLSRFSSVVYTVKGELDDPELNLKTVFSNETSDSPESVKEKTKKNKVMPLRRRR